MEQLPFEKIKREVLIKKEAETSLDYGKRPEDRSVEELISYGVININKQAGPTSHQLSDHVKKILNINKAGHGGTLDPNVTGVLPVALDRATRVVQALLKSGKEYICLMHLHKEVDEKKIYETADSFVGKIKQIPPIRSAVKRQEREREIYYLKILEIDDKDVLFKVGCEAGTYIRKLCFDWGKKLGTGAHMQQLIRTKLGIFNDKNWFSLVDLKDAYVDWKEKKNEKIREIILPFEKAVEHLGKIWVFDSCVNNLCCGSDLYVNGISKLNSNINKDELVAVLSLKNELILLGKAMMNSKEMTEKKEGAAVKTDAVFMEREIYPRINK